MNTNETPETATIEVERENPVSLSAETEKEKHNYKITDEEFIAIYNANFGLCTPTARAIENKYGISYSRQAVHDRCNKLSQKLENQKYIMIDEAKATLFEAITQNRDVKTKIRASMYLLSKTEYGKH